jgi:uncharacterized protein
MVPPEKKEASPLLLFCSEKHESTPMGTTIIYHANCNDGLCAAAVVQRHLEQMGKPRAALIEGDHYERIDDALLERGFFFIVDSCLPSDQMQRLIHMATWIDHHESSIARSVEDKFDVMGGCRQIGKSGALLAWEHLFGEVEVPRLVRLVSERDVWGDPPGSGNVSHAAQAFHAGIHTCQHRLDVTFWEDLLTDDDLIYDIINEGNAALEHNEHTWRAQLHDDEIVRTLTFEDVPAVAVTGRPVGTLSAILAEKYPDTLQVWYRFISKDGGIVQVIELRHPNHESDVNCAEIAMRYGGGGHKGAAGFAMPDLSTKWLTAGRNGSDQKNV